MSYEDLPWLPQGSLPGSRRSRLAHRGPYQAAITPLIASVRGDLPSDLAAAVDDATTAIARFDSELGRELAPMDAVLLRTESAASSRIEDLTASVRAIAEAELLPHRAGGNAARILANTGAMRAATDLADDLGADSILAMHAALMQTTDPDIAGRWRQQQVWIGGSSLGPHSAQYVAPHHARVPAAIDDLVAFLAREDIPVLAHAALAHAQFETIHPFPDGNGRTGRALVHAVLRAKGLTRHVTVPVSAGLLMDTPGYFAALTRYRDGDAAPIIDSFVTAAFHAVHSGRLLAERLVEIRTSWDDRVTARRGAGTWRIADLLLRRPVIDVGLISAELGIAAANAYAPMKPLLDAGILIETTDRRRGRIWRSPEVLDALDEFAERSHRGRT